jgi:hypothetical protein
MHMLLLLVSRNATKKKDPIGKVPSAATKIAFLRASKTPQRTEARLAYQRDRSAASWANETPRETEARLAYQRNRAAASRASESQRETEARLAIQRKRVAATRASVTPVDSRLIAFTSNLNVNYHEHPKVFIGKMDAVCTNCAATKWKDKPPGLCCSN